MLFSFCIEEQAVNYTTYRVHNSAGLEGAACSAELRIHGPAVTLTVHSCAGAAADSPGVRRSAQSGELRGILLPADNAGGLDDCNAFAGSDAGSAPCQALQKTTGIPFEFWRLRVQWTWSSRDRASGDVDQLIFVMGLSDGAAKWPLQLSVIPSSAARPDLATTFEADGGLTNVVLPQRAWRLRLQHAAVPAKPAGLESSSVALLAAAYECHNALARALQLALSSTDCAAAVEAVLPDPIAFAGGRVSRAARAATVCGNSCRPALTASVGQAASICSAAWRAAPLQVALQERPHADGAPVLLSGTPGLRELLSDLIRAADAVYLLAVACASNRRGTSCAEIEVDLNGCPLTTPRGRGKDAVALRTLLLSSTQSDKGGNRVALCKGNCTKVLGDYLFEQDCCVATIAAAEAQWMDLVCKPAAIGPRFWVDWGGGAEPELFLAPSTCLAAKPLGAGTATAVPAVAAASSTAVDLTCWAGQCSLGVEVGVWPTACCDDSKCVNGGVKVASIAFPLAVLKQLRLQDSPSLFLHIRLVPSCETKLKS
jgi:hypothetical protein